MPLLSKPAECRPNFSAALPIYILYIKIGGFTLLDMRVFRIYTYTYIFLQRECTPSNVSLARSEERGKTVAPYFPPFCFSPIPSFTLFPGIPLFFSLPRPPRPLFLRAFWMVDGKGENLAGEWKGEESVYVCVCVESRVRAMIGEFSGKALPNCEFRACFSPLFSSFFGSWMDWSTLVLLHPSFSPFSTSLFAKILKIDFKIGCRFCRFSIGPIVSNVAARMARKRGRSEAKTLSNQSFLAE